jgi:putative membrane protein
MKILFRILAVIFFIVFFGFALKNTDEVTLRFFLGYVIQGPLVLLLLGFFVGGAVLGVLAMLPMVFRSRREVTRNKKALASIQTEAQAQLLAKSQPPQPDAVSGM